MFFFIPGYNFTGWYTKSMFYPSNTFMGMLYFVERQYLILG